MTISSLEARGVMFELSSEEEIAINMATVSFSMYFHLLLPFENRGALGNVLKNV